MLVHRHAAFTICAAIVGAAVLASCAGGGSSTGQGSLGVSNVPPSAAAAATPASAPQSAPVTITLVIPRGGSSDVHSPAYISASTQSVTATIASAAGGTPVNVTQNCPLSTATCTISAQAPAGQDTVSLSLYDQPSGAGNLLAQGTTQFVVQPGVLNTIPIVLGGVVAAIKLLASTATLVPGATQTLTLTVQASDPAGNIIIAPGNYTNAVTLTTSDTTGAVTFSLSGSTSAPSASAVVTSPSQVVSVNYNGSAAVGSSVTFSASATGVPAAKIVPVTLSVTTNTVVGSTPFPIPATSSTPGTGQATGAPVPIPSPTTTTGAALSTSSPIPLPT